MILFGGTTSAPRLQPIAARIVMLQSGMRVAMAFAVITMFVVPLLYCQVKEWRGWGIGAAIS